jgi:hypothetical protein
MGRGDARFSLRVHFRVFGVMQREAICGDEHVDWIYV